MHKAFFTFFLLIFSHIIATSCNANSTHCINILYHNTNVTASQAQLNKLLTIPKNTLKVHIVSNYYDDSNNAFDNAQITYQRLSAVKQWIIMHLDIDKTLISMEAQQRNPSNSLTVCYDKY